MPRINDFSKGLNNNFAPSRLEESAATEFVNVDNTRGTLRSVNKHTAVTGLTGNAIVVADNGDFYYQNDTASRSGGKLQVNYRGDLYATVENAIRPSIRPSKGPARLLGIPAPSTRIVIADSKPELITAPIVGATVSSTSSVISGGYRGRGSRVIPSGSTNQSDITLQFLFVRKTNDASRTSIQSQLVTLVLNDAASLFLWRDSDSTTQFARTGFTLDLSAAVAANANIAQHEFDVYLRSDQGSTAPDNWASSGFRAANEQYKLLGTINARTNQRTLTAYIINTDVSPGSTVASSRLDAETINGDTYMGLPTAEAIEKITCNNLQYLYTHAFIDAFGIVLRESPPTLPSDIIESPFNGTVTLDTSSIAFPPQSTVTNSIIIYRLCGDETRFTEWNRYVGRAEIQALGEYEEASPPGPDRTPVPIVDALTQIAGNRILDSIENSLPERYEYIEFSDDNRMLGILDNKLAWSKVGEFDAFPAQNFILLDSKITGFLKVPSGILLMTETKTFIFSGSLSDPGSQSLNVLSSEHGCLSVLTCKYVGAYPMWLSSDGFCVYGGSRIELISAGELRTNIGPLARIIAGTILSATVFNKVFYIVYKTGAPSTITAAGNYSGDYHMLALNRRYQSESYVEYRDVAVDDGIELKKIKTIGNKLYGITKANVLVECFSNEEDLATMSYTSPQLTEDLIATIKQFNRFRVAYNTKFDNLKIQFSEAGKDIGKGTTLDYVNSDGVKNTSRVGKPTSKYGNLPSENKVFSYPQFSVTGKGEFLELQWEGIPLANTLELS